ncbi:MAG TPA: dihydrofolate reductase [Kiloniellaceae bacterium]|nr:dihydrofolate reductase [Kiloniellaceae bacterium]
MAAPDIVSVVAMGRNRVIGRDGGLPWHISADLKYFKQLTLGKPVVMGRKTYESIGRPLPGRANVVVSRNPGFRPDGVIKVDSLTEALAAGAAAAAAAGVAEICVIGGGEIFAATLDRARRLYVTEIEAAPAGDTFFPEIDPALWHEVSRQSCPPGSESADTPGYSFVIYERR